MELIINIPDEDEKPIRYAFSVQNQPATDAQLEAVVLGYLNTSLAAVARSEARIADAQAIDDLRKRVNPKVGR